MHRKILAIILGAFVSTCVSAQEWSTAVSKHRTEDRSVIFRYMSKFAPGFDRARQPERLIITWGYESRSGMPSLEVRQRMDALEDILQPVVESDGFSTLAIVSTGEDSREWIYYTSSSSAFLQRLNDSLKEQAPFPIEIHVAPDPTWSTYEEFLAGVVSEHG